jgi:hypothetical protein
MAEFSIPVDFKEQTGFNDMITDSTYTDSIDVSMDSVAMRIDTTKTPPPAKKTNIQPKSKPSTPKKTTTTKSEAVKPKKTQTKS